MGSDPLRSLIRFVKHHCYQDINITEKSVTTLDFVWKNQIGDHLEINASAKNLLDPTIERVRENNGGDITISNYKRGINVGLQLKYNF